MNRNSTKWKLMSLCLICLLWYALPAAAQDDVTPFGTGEQGAPNVMLIFDNSESMNNLIHRKPPGSSGNPYVSPDRWRWRRGLQIEGGYLKLNDSGNTLWDETAYTDIESVIPMPSSSPKPMPRLAGKGAASLQSTVTKVRRPNPDSYSLWRIIYDENLDWGAMDINADYRYRLIELTFPKGLGAQPPVTITWADTGSGKYWQVQNGANTAPAIDYTPALKSNDNCLKNNPSDTCDYNDGVITYRIVEGNPGQVTHYLVPSEENTGRYVRDANVDWSAITDEVWNSTYRDKLLYITYHEENGVPDNEMIGQSRRITWRDTNGKYWSVTPGFPKNPNLTTRYEIRGSADDDREASGGHHPASRLYQAKKALNIFLKHPNLKTTDDKYLLNLGFATYMTARVPRTTAKYYRKVKTEPMEMPDRCQARYYNDRLDTLYYSFYDIPEAYASNPQDYPGPFSLTFNRNVTGYEVTHNNLTVGSTYSYYGDPGRCYQYQRTGEVTSIYWNPDKETPRFTIRVSENRRYFAWFAFSDGVECGVTNCQEYPFPEPYSSGNRDWYRFTDCEGDANYQWNVSCVPGGTTDGLEYYDIRYSSTDGLYGVTAAGNPDAEQYIHEEYQYLDGYSGDPRRRYMVQPYKGTKWNNAAPSTSTSESWGANSSTSPEPARGNPQRGNWVLVENVIENVLWKFDSQGTDRLQTGDIVPNVYDLPIFRYPGRGETDKPHGWSYQRGIVRGVYSGSHGTTSGSEFGSSWPASGQKDPYFPAVIGSETGIMKGNIDGDDQIIFVNLPIYVEDAYKRGDDVTGVNITKILNYVDLSRVSGFTDDDNNDSWYARQDYTMMPYTQSLPMNSINEPDMAFKGTPLAASLQDAYKYYESYIAQDGPHLSARGCRDNYVILLTDGAETCDGDPAAAAAQLLSLPGNGVKTFVIGFGLSDVEKAQINNIAQAGGSPRYQDAGGNYQYAYFADDIDSLVEALLSVLQSITSTGSYTRSSPVVTQKMPGDTDIRIYWAYFDYPAWRGHLMVREVDTKGNILDWTDKPIPGWSSACEGNAGCEMANQTPNSRTVFTSDGSAAKINFIPGNAAALKTSLITSEMDINGNGTPNENADAETVINYVLDPTYDNKKYAGTRYADSYWPLGDIYHSKPVQVGKPAFSSDRTGYSTFKSQNATRKAMVYVGSNAGMLHAIDANTGKEDWAYIPQAVLHNLHKLKEGHVTSVDGTPKAADVEVSSGTWKTMIAGGLRDGGRSIYALDITKANDPKPMWEKTDDNMGKTWSTPVFGRINWKGVTTSVVFVGGGLHEDTNKGNRVYILRASDGIILEEITIGSASNNIPAEIYAMPITLRAGEPYNYLENRLFDEDELLAMGCTKQGQKLDKSKVIGNTEVLYFGDTSGALWKISGLNTSSATYAAPVATRLLMPSDPKPVYRRVTVASLEGCRFVLFGTGVDTDNHIALASETPQNYFYEVEDRLFDNSPGGRDDGDYASEPEDGSFRLTWWTAFDEGERMLSDPMIYRGTVYFTTFSGIAGEGASVEEEAECGGLFGESYLYGLRHSSCSSRFRGEDPDNAGLRYDIEGELDLPAKKVTLGHGLTEGPTMTRGKIFFSRTGENVDREGEGLGIGGLDGDPTGILTPEPEAGRLIYWYEGYY